MHFFSILFHLDSRRTRYRAAFTSPTSIFASSAFHLHPHSGGSAWRTWWGCGWRGPSGWGLHQADYLLAASRTAHGIPQQLLCSPTLICLNRPGLTVFPESPGWCMSKWRGHRGDQASTFWGQGLDMTNVHWAWEQLCSLNLDSSTVYLIGFSYFQWVQLEERNKAT